MEGNAKLGAAGGAAAGAVRFIRLHSLPLVLYCIGSPCLRGAEDAADRVRAFYDGGEYAKAIELAEGAPERPADLVLYHGLAEARLERYDEARAVLEAGRGQFPRDKRFPLELAGVAYRQKRLGEAQARLRQALRIDPADKYGNEFLGSLYLLDRDIPAALKYWNRIGKPLIQDVAIAPPPALNDVLRERAIAVSGGQILTLARLRQTERNLDRLDIFSSRRIELTPRADQRYDVTLRLLPAGPILGGWPGHVVPLARDLPYQAVHFDRHNIAARAINFKSLWRWDSDKRRIDLELAGPLRMTPRFGYRAFLDARDENWTVTSGPAAASGDSNEFGLRKTAFGGDLRFALTPKLQWTTGLKLANRSFSNADGSPEFAGGWSFEQRNELRYPLLDLPQRHVRLESAARLRTGRMFGGSPSRFGIVEGDLSGEWKPKAQDSAWEARARLRGGKTFGRIPFDEYLQLGMERDNELWLRGHVGTQDGRKGNAPLGTDYALLQTEFDRRLARLRFLEFRLGPFFDAGRADGGGGSFAPDHWLFDAGAQVKLSVAGGLTWSFVYGRDLRGGQGVFYTSVRY